MKKELLDAMTSYLENACAYLAMGEHELFYYSAGKAASIQTILEEQYNWNEDYSSEHIRNMIDIIDDNF